MQRPSEMEVATLVEMQDVGGSAGFENCVARWSSDTLVSRYSSCIRQGGVEARCYGNAWPNTCCGKPREGGRPEAGGFHLAVRMTTNTCYRV